jgi:hypothetical protein
MVVVTWECVFVKWALDGREEKLEKSYFLKYVFLTGLSTLMEMISWRSR